MRPVVGSSVEQLRSSFTGTYTLERELGRGGMAVVFLATDTKHQRPARPESKIGRIWGCVSRAAPAELAIQRVGAGERRPQLLY